MARIAAKVDAATRTTGTVIPSLELLIGAASIGTRNLLPDLAIAHL